MKQEPDVRSRVHELWVVLPQIQPKFMGTHNNSVQRHSSRTSLHIRDLEHRQFGFVGGVVQRLQPLLNLIRMLKPLPAAEQLHLQRLIHVACLEAMLEHFGQDAPDVMFQRHTLPECLRCEWGCQADAVGLNDHWDVVRILLVPLQIPQPCQLGSRILCNVQPPQSQCYDGVPASIDGAKEIAKHSCHSLRFRL